MNRAVAALFFAPFVFTASANATGFDLREFSPSSLGVSYAGAAADGRYASTLYFNPALSTEVGSFDLSSGATAILTDTDAQYTAITSAGNAISGDASPTGFVTKAVIPDFSMRYRVTDKLALGMTFNMPWGMLSKYPSTWVGRYYAVKSEIQTRNITFSAAYQVLPELSIGGGIQVQYVKAALSKAIDLGLIGYTYGLGTTPGYNDGYGYMTANDWGLGYTFGLTWKPTPDLMVGASFRSRIAHTLTGNEKYTYDAAGVAAYLNAATGLFTNGTVKAAFDTPSVAMIGASYRIDDQWKVKASFDWTGWYSFQQIKAVTEYSTDENLMDYKPSLFGSLGVEYKPDPKWTLRLGTAYDATPTHTKTRVPGIPDTSRIWLTFGVGYSWDKNIDLNFGYAYMFMGHTNISLYHTGTGNSLRGDLNGTSSLAVHLVGLELDYKL